MSRLWKGDRRVLLVFAMYGIVAGVVAFIDSQSYGDDIFSRLSILMNIPTIGMFFYLQFSVADPAGVARGFHPLALIFWLASLWTFIGAVLYGFVRLFRLGP
ncbi:hypothetical protein [Candidatus Nitrososphaera sp. FF02]|uniref:hypothetical protein n=1 Tax=Candidatus Nitrososphaera sp. FF02 TaxID=3398226 RepID=UPI0039E892D9